MATTYPETWLARVQQANKLVLDPLTSSYFSPVGDVAISREAVAARTEAYLKAEAARQRRRLTKDDERVCREFVLLASNWPAIPSAARASRSGAGATISRTISRRGSAGRPCPTRKPITRRWSASPGPTISPSIRARSSR